MGHNLDLLLYGWSVGPPWFAINQLDDTEGNREPKGE